MILVKANEGKVYEAKNHFNMWGVRKFGIPEGAKNVTMSISEFLPDGGATMCSSEAERIYYVLRGSITVTNKQGEEFVLNEEDMIYIPPGEERDMKVNGLVAARVLVIVVKV
ncbi:MAG: cupin domain-containing protein [Desulfitobacteriia bacterium]